MTTNFLLIDGSNLGYASASGPKLTVGDQDVNAVFGVLRMIRPIIARYPNFTPIVLWDGRSWRHDAFEGYKKSRATKSDKSDKGHERQQAAIRDSYKTQVPLIKQGLTLLGVRQMVAENLEADDLAGMLVKRYAPARRVMLITGDKDWIQLVGPGVNWFDPIRKLVITNANLTEKLGYEKVIRKDEDGIVIESEWRGVPDAKAWLQIKALMGDTSDEIPGVGGIGEKGAIDLVRAYGDVGSFLDRLALGELTNLPKKLRDFGSDESKYLTFKRNMDLMDLMSPKIPKPVGLDLKSAPIDVEGFREFCRNLAFASILKELDVWIEPFTQTDLQEAA